MELSAATFVRSFPEFLDRANLARAAVTGVQFLVVAAIAWRIATAFMLRPFHAAPSDDFERRAGAFYAARVGYSVCYLISIPVVIGWLFAFVPGYAPYRGSNFDRPYLVLAFLGWGLAALAAGGVFERLRMGRSPTPVEAWHGFAFSVVLDPFLFLGLPLLAAVSDRLDGPTFTAMAVAALLFLALQRRLGHALLRLYGTIRPVAGPRAAIARQVADEAGLPDLSVWLVRAGGVNAYSMPGRQIYVSEHLGTALDDAQFTALLRHEAAHAREAWYHKLVRHLPPAMMLVLNAGPAFVGELGLERFLFVIAAFAFIYARVTNHSRRLEKQADEYARAFDPPAYDSMLQALHRAAMIPSNTNQRRGTHPDLADRLTPETAAQISPDAATTTANKQARSRAYLGVVLYIACFLTGLAISEILIAKLE
ncbi:MAG: M48 family metalloprotease [Planctomycetales bacterium]|nr:M48 family metalloprotease [Planctomycetales bacterium]MBN8627926.1 M48 family metalloprotease [Planctomycetota bacterium]